MHSRAIVHARIDDALWFFCGTACASSRRMLDKAFALLTKDHNVEIPAARRELVEPAVEGERRLMAELLQQAIIEATFSPGTLRDEARAWLSEAPMFSARECFEALGIDYDVARAKLQAQWAALDAARGR